MPGVRGAAAGGGDRLSADVRPPTRYALSRGLKSASAKARLSLALSLIVWASSITRIAASLMPAVTKSVSARLQLGAALEQRLLISRNPAAGLSLWSILLVLFAYSLSRL